MSSTLPTAKTSSIEAVVAAELGAAAAVSVTGEGVGMSRVSGAEVLGLRPLFRLTGPILFWGSVCQCYLRWEKDYVNLCAEREDERRKKKESETKQEQRK